MKNSILPAIAIAIACSLLVFILLTGCVEPQTVESASGVKMATTKVDTDSNGNTIEQRNIKERLARDNKPGSVKFLYVVSPFTGDLIFQSTVKGKVTSSSKRLTPSDLVETDARGQNLWKRIEIDGRFYETSQNPGDDGTYGDSIPYLYWFDQNSVYHQAYIGGAIVHITDQPMTFYKTTQRIEGR